MTDEAEMLGRCAWCQDDVWSDNDHYISDGYVWHRSCAISTQHLLRDQSVILRRDGDVFQKIANWQNAPSNTASADPEPQEKP